MGDPLVVEVVRSGFVESTHLVDVAVVDAAGRLVASAGDPDVHAAFRSSAKPIQARAMREAGWAPSRDAFLAVACASHNGEPAHVETVRAVLAEAGLDDSALACPPDLPLYADAAVGVAGRARVYHNCSGKHAGMLATCVAAGWPTDGYREAEHPLQRRVRALVASLCGDPGATLVDGCGVPTFVLPLRGFALGFLRIAGGPEAAAMRAHPFLVGGTGRFDTDLIEAAPALLTKAGAEGLSCVAADGVGIAVKVRDGSARARPPAVLSVLHGLGIVDDTLLERLSAHVHPPVLGGGRPVGSLRVRGAIRSA